MTHASLCNSRYRSAIRLSLYCLVIALLVSIAASAQTTSPTDGTTPSSLAPGSPAGSNSLSGFEGINLYNGNALRIRFWQRRCGIVGPSHADDLSNVFDLHEQRHKSSEPADA